MKNTTMFLGMALGVLGLIGTADQAMAGAVVADRSDLNAILGSSAMNEGFETYSFGGETNTATLLYTNGVSTTTLDSTTVANDQGPGLVIPGLSITDSSGIQWNSTGYYGLVTQSLSGGLGPLVVSFTSLTTAFGLDLETYSGYPNTFTVTVYAQDDTTVLYTTSITASVPTPAVFFGYQDAGGIGAVSFSNPSQGFSPVIDNVEFGSGVTSVPEPSTMVLAGIAGLVGLGYYAPRRQKGVA
jgi:PEP-CTERM motif